MEYLVFIIVGLASGVVAGLLGVGGGIVIVPALDLTFAALNYPESTSHHVALGTSLAVIVFTAISSARAHNKRGAVRWPIFKSITPGILIGTFFGAWLASLLTTVPLKAFFAVFLLFVAVQMLMDIKPKASRELPGMAGMTGAGGVIGIVSALVGIGGGTMTVPFMTWCNVPIHHAVGTASAIGFPIAVAGALGFIVNGMGAADLPDNTFGYVSVPAFVCIAAMSFLTAPLGAKLAHSLPVKSLKKVFAVFLLAMSARMFLSVM